MPFRDYQATVVEMIASCTNSAYVTLLSLPVVVSASSYAGDDICLIVAAAGTVLTAAQQALESLSMIICMVLPRKYESAAVLAWCVQGTVWEAPEGPATVP